MPKAAKSPKVLRHVDEKKRRRRRRKRLQKAAALRRAKRERRRNLSLKFLSEDDADGTNLTEALITAAVGSDRPLTIDEMNAAIDDLGIRPTVTTF